VALLLLFFFFLSCMQMAGSGTKEARESSEQTGEEAKVERGREGDREIERKREQNQPPPPMFQIVQKDSIPDAPLTRSAKQQSTSF